MCLYVRVHDTGDWDLLVGPELLSPIPESDQSSNDCVSQKPPSRVLWRDRTSQTSHLKSDKNLRSNVGGRPISKKSEKNQRTKDLLKSVELWSDPCCARGLQTACRAPGSLGWARAETGRADRGAF